MDEISPIKKRVLEYIDYKGITKKDFCLKTKISESNMKGRSLKSELGGEALINILQEYDEISSVWLILGKGEMIQNTNTENKEILFYEKLLESKEKEIEMKDEIIDNLKDHIRTLKNMPEMGHSNASVG